MLHPIDNRSIFPIDFYKYYQKSFKIMNYSGFNLQNPGRKVFIKPYVYDFKEDQQFYDPFVPVMSSILVMDKINKAAGRTEICLNCRYFDRFPIQKREDNSWLIFNQGLRVRKLQVKLHSNIYVFRNKAVMKVRDIDLVNEARRPLHLVEDRGDLFARENSGKRARGARTDDVREPGEVLAEDLSIQEEEAAEGLVLRGRRDLSLRGEVREELRNFGMSHHGGMAFTLEEDEPADPADIGLLGAAAEVSCPDRQSDLFEQLRRSGRGWRRFVNGR